MLEPRRISHDHLTGWAKQLRHSRLRWGFSYLLLVPVAAFAYSLLPPGGLHDENIKYEPSLRADARQLQAVLQDQVRSRIPSRARWRFGRLTYELIPASVFVGIAPGRQGEMQITLSGDYRGGEDRGGSFIDQLILSIDELTTFEFTSDGKEEVTYPVSLSEASIRAQAHVPVPPLSVLLPPLKHALEPTKTHSYIAVSGRGSRQIESYIYANEGDPYFSSGRYWRMLYLSATTVTTLGLGDITPISGVARGLVGFEALLGIIFIGLFLNDLARGASRRGGT